MRTNENYEYSEADLNNHANQLNPNHSQFGGGN